MVSKIEFSCCFCAEKHTAEINMPEGWESNDHDIEDALCPRHALIAAFRDSQCPGCVGGWLDCGLWKAFAFSRLDLNDADFMKIRRGVCPKRVNGTFSMSAGRGGLHDIDLSKRAPTDAGDALADAIIEYCSRFHGTAA